MDAFTAALQLHQDNYACFVQQDCSMIDLGPIPSNHQFRGQKEYLAVLSQFVHSGFLCQQG